jgi:hypothetical protein
MPRVNSFLTKLLWDELRIPPLQSTIFIAPFLPENIFDEKAWQRSPESAYGLLPVEPFEASIPLSFSGKNML